MPAVIRYRILPIVAWALLLAPAPALAQEIRVAVLFPQVEEPYREVFQTILRGLRQHADVRTVERPVTDSADVSAVTSWLKDERADVVIGLGKQGFMAANQAAGKLPALYAALPLVPDGLSGISLSPDPSRLFQALIDLAPRVERIHVVYSAPNEWLIRRAEKSARAQGLALSAHPVGTLREAVRQYRDLLQSLQNGSEAIWLPLDNISASDDIVLPMLLQAAWDQGLVLFSSKPSHAQRGVLFSMFPDHLAMGERLAEMAVDLRRSREKPGVVPLAELQLAVNLRTAAHLGLRFSSAQQDRFDLVFPSR